YWWGWGDLVFRWLHVIAAIAWIGSSFYFIALDNHLEPPRDPRDSTRGIGGEAWEIHGGGFYRVEKFRVAPARLPETLHWFKWEAYTTWLSGFALFIAVYYSHASTMLVDPSVADLRAWQAILISIAGLVIAWLVYDALCRRLGEREWLLALAVFVSVALAAWGAGELFAARAAYLQVGAMLGTVMVANVFFVIIPAHWELVRAKEAGRDPDPRWNARGKQRSVHNNYLTLPVVFAMLSNHFPFTYGHRHAWLILVVLLVLGAWTRHFFNLRHRGRNAWWILVTAAAGVAVLAVLIRPSTPVLHAAGAAPPFARVQAIVQERCAPCHSLHPTQPGYPAAPLGIRFDTRAEIETQAGLIAQLAVQTQTMPPGNVTHMTPAERAALARWLASR
ncbi:MAG TPA: urate hydroxylase PuuD, partial [Gaiellaceae bacterium]|nr:urate hydroxylase PuuD [Gaiellaceae bacterium]